MRRPRLRRFKGEHRYWRHGFAWGRYTHSQGELPGMLTTRPPEWSLKPAELARWAAFDKGLIEGYITQAAKVGEEVVPLNDAPYGRTGA